MANVIKRSVRGAFRRLGYDIVHHGPFADVWPRPEAHQKGLRSILVVSIPKSGTVYINGLLTRGLRRPNVSLGLDYFPDDRANYRKVEVFAGGGYVASAHFSACEQNLRILGAMLDRWVVHIRDPRSVVLSLTHHLDRQLRFDPRLLYAMAPAPPPGFATMSPPQKLSWTVENHLEGIVKWIRDWREVKDRNTCNIRFTTYEELHRDELAYAQGVLDFFDIPRSTFLHPKLERNIEQTHFRRGLLAEWRTAFAPGLLALTNEIIGRDLLEWFNWPLY